MLLGFFGACFATASSGAVFKPGDWYENLAKPPWNPPNWLFPPAWSVFYTLIAIAGWLVWRQVGFGLALVVYGVHLLLNAAWSAIFFGLKRPDLRLRRAGGLLALDRRHHRGLRPDQRHGGLAAGALPGLGQLRRGAELVDLAAQPGDGIRPGLTCGV